MRSVYATIFTSLVIVSALTWCHSNDAAENQDGKAIHAPDKSGPRELSAQEASEVLGVPKEYVEILTQGFPEKKQLPKEKLTEDKFEAFRHQFGRLPNDSATFQVKSDVYFVLISLSDLERQPKSGKSAESKSLKPDPANKEAVTKGGKKIAFVAIPAKKLPTVVDHRAKMKPIRDQGQRGTCVAFAACAELEVLAQGAMPVGERERLCENLAYLGFMEKESSTPCKDLGLPTYRAAEHLMDRLICAEKHWSYVPTDPAELRANGQCGKIDTPPKAISGKMGCGVKDYLLLPTSGEVVPDGTIDIKDTLTLEKILYDGRNIVFGTIVAWSTKDSIGVIDVKLGPAGQPIFGAGGHAMVIVGYDKSGKTPHFIVRNSWGDSYGHKGYLFLSYDYIRTYARYGYVTTEIRTGMLP